MSHTRTPSHQLCEGKSMKIKLTRYPKNEHDSWVVVRTENDNIVGNLLSSFVNEIESLEPGETKECNLQLSEFVVKVPESTEVVEKKEE